MLQIFITGVSSGIGLALAQAYLERGEQVFGVSRRNPPDTLIERPQFHFRSIDLAQLEQIAAPISDFLKSICVLDLVILNAASLGRITDLADTTIEEMTHAMRVNVWSNKLLLDALRTKGIEVRQVVAISSGAAEHPSRGFGAYSVSKAALNMLIGQYAVEQPEVHFCALAPGLVDTPMQAKVASLPHDARFPAVEMLKAAHGTSHMPPPEQIAERLISAFEKARRRPSGVFLNFEQMAV